MRQFIIASHAHFAAGINESVSLLSGERDNVRTLSMYVDGNDDIAAAARAMVEQTPEGDDLVICTDLFGGSVNNEFTKIVQERPGTYLVTNMNLARAMVEQTPEGDDLVICTDLFGGSVNNEFTKIVQERPGTYLVTNMNLPLLIQLLFADDSLDTADVLREICASDDTRVKFVNDLIEDTGDDEEF